MRIKTKLHELKDADVSFVSLVGRGANRIPFRIIKSQNKEHHMGVDLSSIGRVLKGTSTKKAAQVGTEIAGVVVFDHGDKINRAVKTAISEQGFHVDRLKKYDDGTMMYIQGDAEPKDGEFSIVRLSEQMAVVVKGFEPYCYDLTENATFADTMATQGFYQGMRTACDALCTTVSAVLMKAESPTDAVAKMEDSVSAFGAYLTALVKGLPVQAFKADQAVLDAVAKATKKPDGDDGKEKDGDQDENKGMGEVPGDATTNPAAASPAGGNGMGQVPGPDAPGIASGQPTGGNGFGQVPGGEADNPANKNPKNPNSTAKSMKDPDGDGDNDMQDYCAGGGTAEKWKAMSDEERMAWSKKNRDSKQKAELAAMIGAAVKGALGEIDTAIKSVKDSVAEIAEAQKSAENRIDQIARKSEDASKAIKGLVIGAPAGDDVPAQDSETVKKSDSPFTGCFDTGLMRRRG